MVNPAYRLLLGTIVILSGIGGHSAQAQYGPPQASSQTDPIFTSAAYRPQYAVQPGYESVADYNPMLDQYVTGYERGPYPGPGDQSNMIVRTLPVDRGWAYDNPVDGYFKNIAQNSWMRIEYLLWKAPPGDQLVGTRTTSTSDPRQPFTLVDANGVPVTEPDPADPTMDLLFSTKVADLSTIGQQGANGIRGTFGIDFNSGSVETTFFGMESDVSSISYGQSQLLGSEFGQTDRISITTFANGEIGETSRSFNRKYAITYQTQTWGVESNYVINTESLFFRSYGGAGGLQLRPILGFRYLKIGEDMLIQGSFEDPNSTPAVALFDTTIRSATDNKLYVPQAGIRMEFVHPWFTISAQPKVGFGVNNYNGSVYTNQFLDSTDPVHITTVAERKFTPTFEFGVNARIHLTEYFTFNVGYNFLWANHIARPGTITNYNINSGSTNGVSLKAQNSLDTYKLHGLVLGGEISWP